MMWTRDGYTLTTDPGRVDLDVVHGFLRDSYWARGIGRDLVARSISGSLVFSLFSADRQIGFARVVSDRATFAYLADVFVVEAERGKGLGRWMVDAVVAHPELQGLRRWYLVTRDAHALYAPIGFGPLAAPERHMEKVIENPYR